jgi:hypothetical protein
MTPGVLSRPIWLIPAINVLTLAAVALGSFVIIGLFASTLYQGHLNGVWVPVFKERFLAIVGVPTGVFTSIGVVEFFKGHHGPVKIKFGAAAEFDGATGPVILWIFCFSNICILMKLMW